MLYSICKNLLYIFFVLFCRFDIQGRECIPRRGPFILVSNHVSNLDPTAVGCACPRKLSYLAKEELFSTKLSAAFLRRLGCIPVKRQRAGIKTLRQCLETLRLRPLLIFPQGRRSADFDAVGNGVGFLQKKTGVPVIAARVFGTDKVMPKGALLPRPAQIKVIYSLVDGILPQDTEDVITAKIVNKIKNL